MGGTAGVAEPEEARNGGDHVPAESPMQSTQSTQSTQSMQRCHVHHQIQTRLIILDEE